MNSSDVRKIEQSIALLQEVLGQKSGGSSGSSSKITIPNFDQEVNNFIGLSQSLEK